MLFGTSPPSHVHAAVVLLDGPAALGAWLGVGQDPEGVLAVALVLQVPGTEGDTRGRGGREVREGREVEVKVEEEVGGERGQGGRGSRRVEVKAEGAEGVEEERG